MGRRFEEQLRIRAVAAGTEQVAQGRQVHGHQLCGRPCLLPRMKPVGHDKARVHLPMASLRQQPDIEIVIGGAPGLRAQAADPFQRGAAIEALRERGGRAERDIAGGKAAGLLPVLPDTCPVAVDEVV